MIKQISDLLERCEDKDNTVMPPTELFNEGWLLRVTLNWFAHNRSTKHKLAFQDDSRWYSEAQIATRFKAEYKGDPVAETHSRADGVIGHFAISPSKKGGGQVTLEEARQFEEERQFVVVEAKLGSPLSKGVKNAKNYGQASRLVACMANVIDCANLHPDDFSSLGFYVVAPKQQIEKGVFKDFVTDERIKEQVEKRLQQYDGRHDKWHKDIFTPTIEKINLDIIQWEEIINHIDKNDPEFGIGKFYARCKTENKLK